MKRCEVSVVTPCYNEASNVRAFYSTVAPVLEALCTDWELIFVNDGSTDSTLETVISLRERDPRVKVVSLSRNFGHQLALAAGLRFAVGRAVVTMDSDLQHPPKTIARLLDAWRRGARVVIAVRAAAVRSISKTLTSRLFYWALNRVAEVRLTPNAADFRLLDYRVVRHLNAMPEHARFLRGQVAWLGFSTTTVSYEEDARLSGQSKYSLRKMLRLARDAVTSSSVKPLVSSAWLGCATVAFAMCYAAYAVFQNIAGRTVPGWTSALLAVLMLGGIQLIVLSVHGLYLGQIYAEVRARPLYCIDLALGVEDSVALTAGRSKTGGQ